LNDLQLALVLVRLYEPDHDKLAGYIKSILFAEVLGYTLTPEPSSSSASTTVRKSDSFGKLSETPNPDHVSPDPFLRSMSLWYVKDYRASLNTLYDIDLDNDEARLHATSNINSSIVDSIASGSNEKKESTISHVFNFYTFLKQHPLLLRQQLVEESTAAAAAATRSLTPIERRLHFVAAYFHLINGCPLLTLDILSKLPRHIASSTVSNVKPKSESAAVKTDEVPSFDFTDNAVPKKVEKAEEFDWSAPSGANLISKRFDDEELDLAFSDDDDEDEGKKSEKEEEVKTVNLTDEVKLKNTAVVRKESLDVDEESGVERVVDTFAQQIKFISCLKILIEEMSTLSTGFEVVGGQLRYYMYYWLERETQVLRELGDYGNAYDSSLPLASCDAFGESAVMADASFADETLSFAANNEANNDNSALLHEQLLNDERLFQTKVQRLNKRKEWLRSNELLLRTFLSYCSLHSANGGNYYFIILGASVFCKLTVHELFCL
jgi:hypothetical protein